MTPKNTHPLARQFAQQSLQVLFEIKYPSTGTEAGGGPSAGGHEFWGGDKDLANEAGSGRNVAWRRHCRGICCRLCAEVKPHRARRLARKVLCAPRVKRVKQGGTKVLFFVTYPKMPFKSLHNRVPRGEPDHDVTTDTISVAAKSTDMHCHDGHDACGHDILGHNTCGCACHDNPRQDHHHGRGTNGHSERGQDYSECPRVELTDQHLT